jgi:hypothetical protein
VPVVSIVLATHFTYSIKTIAFIAGKKNPAIQKFFIRFSIDKKLKK